MMEREASRKSAPGYEGSCLIEIPPSAIAEWGSEAVFANVLLTRLGVPVPSAPLLVYAGSEIAGGRLLFSHVLFAAVLAALLGDCTWFTAGRVYGRRLIGSLARFSAAADSGVHRASALFERFGAPIVSVCKFVPGLGIVTPPLMGTTQIAPAAFLFWDFAGAMAWAAFWLLGGALLERQVARLVAALEPSGATVIDLLVAAALAFLAYRCLRRWAIGR
jgi:membrane protein DedA with SNARE-associated domain